MNRIAKSIKKGQIYDQTDKKRRWLMGVVILLLAVMISVGLVTKTVTAQKSSSRTKLVTSIEVKRGDTLWSIATKFMSDEYDSLNDYIDEIKYSNGITSDEIHAGNYIIVPYYADASY